MSCVWKKVEVGVDHLADASLGGLSYFRTCIPKMVAASRSVNRLLTKGTQYVFTAEHGGSVTKLFLKRLASPEVLAFPDFAAAISGTRPFCLVADASEYGLGAVGNGAIAT